MKTGQNHLRKRVALEWRRRDEPISREEFKLLAASGFYEGHPLTQVVLTRSYEVKSRMSLNGVLLSAKSGR